METILDLLQQTLLYPRMVLDAVIVWLLQLFYFGVGLGSIIALPALLGLRIWSRNKRPSLPPLSRCTWRRIARILNTPERALLQLRLHFWGWFYND